MTSALQSSAPPIELLSQLRAACFGHTGWIHVCYASTLHIWLKFFHTSSIIFYFYDSEYQTKKNQN